MKSEVEIEDGFTVEVLQPDAKLILLGTVLNLTDVTKHEIANRIAAGWKLFRSLKLLLLNRRLSVRRRLQLVDATVGSCIAWCCESWTLRVEEAQQLEVARRSMLGKIASAGREAK